MRNRRLLAAFALLVLTACGQKGALILVNPAPAQSEEQLDKTPSEAVTGKKKENIESEEGAEQ